MIDDTMKDPSTNGSVADTRELPALPQVPPAPHGPGPMPVSKIDAFYASMPKSSDGYPIVTVMFGNGQAHTKVLLEADELGPLLRDVEGTEMLHYTWNYIMYMGR